MLSYQHSFHAGGPADVHKHAGLCLLLNHLAGKEKPFVVIDLYAGDGIYNLASEPAQKLKEFSDGICKIYSTSSYPSEIAPYINIVRNLNTGNVLDTYPGSPFFSKNFLREGDRLVLNELHPSSYRTLKHWKSNDSRISLHKRNALEALLGLVPPSIRRGLVFIDPSYEVKSEFADIPLKVKAATTKWPQGIYALWYPILQDDRHELLVSGIKQKVETDTYRSEVLFSESPKFKSEHSSLRGSGLLVINPPWKFELRMTTIGDWIAKQFTGESKYHTASWLISFTQPS